VGGGLLGALSAGTCGTMWRRSRFRCAVGGSTARLWRFAQRDSVGRFAHSYSVSAREAGGEWSPLWAPALAGASGGVPFSGAPGGGL